MRYAIVGVGHIGAIYARYLEKTGFDIVTVDPTSSGEYDSVEDVDKLENIDAWVVATPTATHIGVLHSILQRSPSAHVLLEKPVCVPKEIEMLAVLVDQHPLARIKVSDVYAHSSSVDLFRTQVMNRSKNDPLRYLSIEFTKNRRFDEVHAGRFVDEFYGNVGYEWFHMLSVMRQVLTPAQYRLCLESELFDISGDISATIRCPGVPVICLYSSMDGVIGNSAPVAGLFVSDIAERYIEAHQIPYRSAFRYRVADAVFDSGAHITLVFEPAFGTKLNYKNQHSVVEQDGDQIRRHDVAENHLLRALLAQLEVLAVGDLGSDSTRLAEHRYMARIGRAFSEVLSEPHTMLAQE